MSRRPKTALRRPLGERRESYLRVFVLSFMMMILMIIPVMIYTNGYFVYYGDFNAQQLPFYYLAHDAVQHGAFGWNWLTDLGANFIGSYSFYLLGSPFFWLTVPFPQDWVSSAVKPTNSVRRPASIIEYSVKRLSFDCILSRTIGRMPVR